MDIKPIPKVYIVQQQFMVNPGNHAELIPKFDFSSAKEFGSLEILLSPQANPFSIDLIKTELWKKLETFNSRDYLLLVGNPVLMAVTSCIAYNFSNGPVQFLQWSGKDKKYIRIKFS